MRVLLDECVPRKLRRELPGHEVRTVVEMGWAGTKNGTLLRRTALKFDVLITVDQGIPHQQHIENLSLALVLIKAPSNDINDLRPKMPRVLQILTTIQPGQVVRC